MRASSHLICSHAISLSLLTMWPVFGAMPNCCRTGVDCPAGICNGDPEGVYCVETGEEYAGWQVGANQTLALVGRAIILQLWRGRDAWNLDAHPQRARLWGSESVMRMRLWDGNEPSSNFKNTGAGLVLGADWSPNPSWTWGGFWAYTKCSQHWETLPGMGDSRGLSLGAYCAWSAGATAGRRDGWYANLLAYAATIRGFLQREPLCRPMRTSLHGPAWAGTFEVGYRFYSGWAFHWQPFASISPSWFRRAPFTEECGDSALRMCGPAHLSWKPSCSIGMRFSTEAAPSPSGILVSPELLVRIVQALTSPASCVEVGRCEDHTTQSACAPPSPWTTSQIGAGALLRFSEHAHLRVRFNSEQGKGLQRMTFVLQASLAF